MGEIDPRKIQELSESFNELTGTVRYASQAVQSMLDAESAKKLKQSNDERAAVEKAESQRQAAETSKAASLEAQQNKLFQDELRWRGYKVEETGKLVKTSVELTQSQKQSLEALDKRIAKERELAEVIKDPVKSFRNISGSVNSLEGIMGQMQEKMFEMTGKSVPMAVGLTAVTAAVTGATKAALGMADSLYKGERGAKVGAKAVKDLSDTITKAAYGISAALMFLPGLGWAAKLAGAAIGLFAIATEGSTKLIEMGAEYNDKVYDSFNKLSESGLTTSKGMSGVSNTMEKLGVTSAEIEKMNTLLSSNSKDLALFGGTAAGGLEKFTEVAGKISHPASELNKKLMLLGITADEQREHTLKYMALQTRMGMMQGKTQADLIKGSVAYMEELDRIAAITGIGRKEQEEAQKQVMAIEELRAAMYQAEKSGDTKRQKELEQSLKYSTRLMAEGRKKEAAGFAKYMAAGKNVVDAESAAAAQSSRGAMEAIEAGKTGEDVYQAGSATSKEALKRVARTKAIGGDVSSQVLDFNASIDAQKRNEKLLEDAKKAGYGPERLEEYAKKVQKEKTEKPDPQLEKNVEAIQLQQKAGLVLDQAAKKMDGAGLAMASSVKAFNEAVALFNRATGGDVKQGVAVEKAKQADTAALNKQQAAMDANAKTKADPNATKAQKAEAQKAEEDANKDSMKAMAAKREAFLKEQNDLREINKKQRIAGKEVYKTMEDARKAGAAPAVAPAAAAPAAAPSTSKATGDTSGPDAEGTPAAPAGKPPADEKKAAPTTAAAPVALKSNKTDLLIANEPVSADKPLSKAQMAMIELGISQGNKFPEMVMQKFNSQMFGPATPQSTPETVNVNKALEGGIFSGPGSSSSGSSMSTVDILSSLKNSFSQVDRKSVESELPELAGMAGSSAGRPSQKSATATLLEELSNLMEQKLSDVIDAVNDNNDIKEEILLYSKA